MSSCTYFAYDWATEKSLEPEVDEDGRAEVKPFTVYSFGVTDRGETVCVKIKDFKPIIRLRLPESWKNEDVNRFVNFIKKRYLYSAWKKCSAKQLKKFRRFDGFTNNQEFQFLEFQFDDMMTFYRFRKVLTDKVEPRYLDASQRPKNWLLPVYDSDLEPMLRMMHTQDILSCGWISIDRAKFVKTGKDSKSMYEFEVSYKDVRPASSSVTSQPKLLIASFDLECTNGGDGNFPQYDNPNHTIIQIGCTISAYGQEGLVTRYIATLGSCSDIDGAIVEAYTTEEDMILGFVRFVERSKIHILTGYNIYGFDFRYLYRRAELLEIEEELLEGLSWLSSGPARYVEKQLVSSGLGDNWLYLLEMPGIVTIDIMKVLQGDPSKKLSSWKLDHVAEHFTGQKKDDVKRMIVRRWPNIVFKIVLCVIF
jgi:DNA polymerase delta subunit 1